MSALPRPDLPPGPHRDLVAALHDLHHRAGWPSLRTLAREAGVSHTTVSKTFSSPAIPTWGTLELLVEAMDGDPTTFHDLWLAATTDPTDGTDPGTPRIAGRTAELTAVRRHLETGTGLLLVTGEAGIGKTKLVTTAAQTTDTFVATGHCLPLSTAVPLLPFADALRRAYESDGGGWFAEALAHSAPYVAGSVQRLVPEVERIVDTDPQPQDDWSGQRLFAAVGATLKALGDLKPLALVIEDLHWGDAATLDLIEHLAARGLPVPVLGSFRTDDPRTADSSAAWLGRVRRLATTAVLSLAPLTSEETTQQLALVLGRPPSPEVVATVHERSRGLPLFTEQLAGVADADQPLPALLGDLLEARLVGLGESAWSVARVLGVADRGLPADVVRRAGALSQEAVGQGLHELSRWLLLAPHDEQDLAQLRHPLLAEAIRRRLVAGEAAALHRCLAIALAETCEPEPAEVATHWQRAAVPDQEVVWRIAAARAAADRYAANEEAEQWLRVLELYASGHRDPGGPSLGEVYCEGIDAVWDVGRAQDSMWLVQQALEHLDDLADPDDLASKPRADLYFRAGARSMGTVSPAESLDLVEQAIDIYRRLAPTTELALALARRASLLGARGRWDEAAEDMAAAADACLTIGDIRTLRSVRAEQAWQEAMLGGRDAALERIAEAAALVTSEPDPTGDIRLGVFATDIILKCGGSAGDVIEAARRGMDAARTWETSIFAVALLRSNISEALTRAGDVAAAAAIIDPACTEPVAGEQWPVQVEKAHLDAVRGRLDDAADRAGSVVMAPNPSLAYRLETLSISAVIDLWRGEPAQALDALLPLIDEAASTGSSQFAGPHLVLAARAAADMAASGTRPRPGRGREELDDELRGILGRMQPVPFGSASVFADALAHEASWHAEMSRLVGAPDLEHWSDAVREWDRLRRPHDAAYCRWRAAQVALREGRGTLAARLLKRAASDASQHVPLSRAIAATTAGDR